MYNKPHYEGDFMEAKEEQKTIKLYRAVPSIGLTRQPVHSCGPEGVYNLAGYISKESTINNSPSSTINRKAKEDGKFFFFFPEHAITLPQHFPHLFNYRCLKLLEYEFPIDIAFKLTGYGYYGYSEEKIPETYVYYSDIKGDIINSSSLSKEEKKELLIKSVASGIDLIRGMDMLNEKVSEMSNEEIAKSIVARRDIDGSTDGLYRHDYDLIKGEKYIRRSWDYATVVQMEKPYSKNVEYLKNHGLEIHDSKEAKNDRSEFRWAIVNDDIDKAQSLLLDYHKKYYPL